MFEDIVKDILKSLRWKGEVGVSGELNLTIPDVINVAKRGSKVSLSLSDKAKKKIDRVHKEMLAQVEEGIPIYGVNAAYGARVGLLVNEGSASEKLKKSKKLSESIIHVDVSTGPSIEKEIVRAAILLRINTLLAGHSAVRLETIGLLVKLLNLDITPVIGQYGSLGASGDLAMNGRVLATLLQNDDVKVIGKNGRVRRAKYYLKKMGLERLELDPKEGLGLTNGDNFSTATALISTYEVFMLMLVNTAAAALTIQALKGSVRNYHKLISDVRPHKGQQFSSALLRYMLEGSKLAYQDLKRPMMAEAGQNIQDPYSIRCLPQYQGPDWEALSNLWDVLKINMNSISDNPLWTTPENVYEDEKPYQWVSGGNFLAMHMVELIDRLRKVLTHVVKQNDRHLARLVHPQFNNGLPPNLSDRKAISKTTFKGLQNQMGMYEVYSTVLSVPVSTAFGSHEEFNQDITSHAFTSGIIARELIRVAKYSVATNLIAASQAIDLRGGGKLLSPYTRQFYRWVRGRVPYVEKEQALGSYVEKVSEELLSDELIKLSTTGISKL
jgi:phenylalanine ammonia-lyase